VRRAQRDTVLAEVTSAAAAVHDAMTIRARGGDPKTLWDKVCGVSESILNVQVEGGAGVPGGRAGPVVPALRMPGCPARPRGAPVGARAV
jgi:hypothetical protein